MFDFESVFSFSVSSVSFALCCYADPSRGAGRLGIGPSVDIRLWFGPKLTDLLLAFGGPPFWLDRSIWFVTIFSYYIGFCNAVKFQFCKSDKSTAFVQAKQIQICFRVLTM